MMQMYFNTAFLSLLHFLKAVNPEVNLVLVVFDFLASTSIKASKINHSHKKLLRDFITLQRGSWVF